MAKRGRHTFIIPKHETPTVSTRDSAIKKTDFQHRLRTLGRFSRNRLNREEWPSNPERR